MKPHPQGGMICNGATPPRGADWKHSYGWLRSHRISTNIMNKKWRWGMAEAGGGAEIHFTILQLHTALFY